MRRAILILLMLHLVAGCASTQSLQTIAQHCTRTITKDGRLLRFCQADRELSIFEAKISDHDLGHQPDMVDDPELLLALQREIRHTRGHSRARRLIAKACVVRGRTYVDVELHDLMRMLGRSATTTDASPI